LVCGALLLFANIALGDGGYQRTKDGKTLVWNNDPAPGDGATWSGDRDREGYAHGFGTLSWYLPGQGSSRPALYARYWGNMVQGKFNGPVNAHSKRKTAHAIFADGTPMTGWAGGPAPQRAYTQWRAVVARRSSGGEAEAPAEGPLIQKSAGTVTSPVGEETETQDSEENAQLSPSANATQINSQPPEIVQLRPGDIADSLRLLAWPPPGLGVRSMSKGSLGGASISLIAHLTKKEVLDLADAAARSHSYDPSEYQRAELEYDASLQAWSLLYEKADDGTGETRKHLSVAVADKTRRTALVGRKQ
jgi:hypothetical protein